MTETIDDFYNAISPYRDKLLTVARIKLGNAFDAEDAVEDALLKAYDNYTKLRLKGKIYPWVKRILINHINDMFKKSETSLDGTVMFKVEDSGSTFDSRHIEIETMEKILDCMLTIEPMEYAEVLILHFYRQFSYEQIAEETKTPIGTVKSRLNRAKEAFVKKVKSEGIDMEEMRALRLLSEWPSVRFS